MKVTKVVHAFDVEQHTRDGWVLVCTHANAQRIATEQILDKRSGYDERNQWHPDLYNTIHATVTDPLFVLEKDSETLGREATQQTLIDMQRQVQLDLETEVANLKADVEMARKQSENAREALTRSEERKHAAEASLSAERSKLYKLEGHLAKVRKEIGEARWREVVDADA